MSEQTIIKLKNVTVVGVDTNKRASSLRKVLFSKDKLHSIKIPILNNINFSANKGEVIGIIGRNGSGKSSLLKTIANIYPIEKGTIEVNGKIAPLIEMGVGFDYELSGRSNIKIALCYSGRLLEYSKELEREIISFAELEEHIDVALKHYSSGMVARLAFAVSVLQHPDILLLDEVLATGDSNFINKSYNYMRKKLQDVDIALLVNHSIDQIRALCTRCVYMKKGNIVDDGNPNEVIKNYEEDSLMEK